MKLTPSQQRLLVHLQKRKERERLQMCIIEGEKFVRDARDFVEFTFTERDTPVFREVISTDSPQRIAAVARVPAWKPEEVFRARTVLILDGVQDPGNVGTLFRLALAFDAALVLVESAEVTNPKTVRASAGAVFSVPWMSVDRDDVEGLVTEVGWPVYRLELRSGACAPRDLPDAPLMLLVGNEGQGIRLRLGQHAVAIAHNPQLESLNVAVATGIILYERGSGEYER